MAGGPDALTFLGRRQVEEAISPAVARAAIAAALAAGPPRQITRTCHPFGPGELMVMPAEDGEYGGVKVLTLSHTTSAAGLYVLFDVRSLQPLAALDAAALTELRTAAVSAFVVERLAPEGPANLVLFGCGAQARSHLRAIAEVRRIERLCAVVREPARAASLLALAEELKVPSVLGGPDSVAEAGIICCCTSSQSPLFDGTKPPPGAVVVAIGSHDPARREVDTATVRRSRVVVETRESALGEAGDLLVPLRLGAFSELDVAADLFELAAGPLPEQAGRDLVLFKSVGVAFEDLALARLLIPCRR